MVQRARAAHDQVGQDDRDHDDDDQRHHAHEDRVLRGHPQLFLEGLLVVAEGEAGREHRALALAEGQIDDVDLRQEGDRAEQVAVEVHQEAPEARGRLLLHRVQGVDGEFEAAGGPLLQEEDDGRHDDGDHRQRRGEVVVAAVLAQVLVVEQDREGLEALAQHGGRAEVREGLHEDHQRGREDRRHGEVQHDLEQALHADAAHVGGGLHQGVVDALEGAVHVDEHEREELQRLREGDAAEAVDARELDAEGGLEELRDDARAPEQHDPGVGPEEGGRHAAEDADDEEDLRALQAVEGVEVGEGDADHQGQRGDEEGDLKAVDDRFGVIALSEELLELFPGHAPVGHDDRLLDDADHRVDQHRDEQQEHDDGDGEPSVKTFLHHGVSLIRPSGSRCGRPPGCSRSRPR